MNVSLIISSTFAPEYDDTYDVTGDLQNRPEISDEREWNAVANDGLEDGPKAVGESKGGVRLRRPPLGWTDGRNNLIAELARAPRLSGLRSAAAFRVSPHVYRW